MIVHCTGCQARFRVPDEKVGPRGARIRCSRCGTLFAVGIPGATGSTPLPSAQPVRRVRPEVELETPPPPPRLEVAADDPFAGFRLDAGPPFGPPRTELDPAADPFEPRLDPPVEGSLDRGGVSTDPLAPGRTAQVGRLDVEGVEAADPAWAGVADAEGPGPAFPPARAAPRLEQGAEPAWMDDPFAAALSPRTERSSLSDRSLPLTDLADLLGEPERPSAVPPPLPTARASASRGEPGLGLDGPDLALEEPAARPPPGRIAEVDPLGAFPSGVRGGELASGPSELGALAADDEPPLALATDPAPDLPEMWRDGPTHVAEPEEAAATTAPAVQAAPPEGAARASAADAPPAADPARRGALRSVAVNAASLAALLVLALGFRVLWRGPGAGEAAASPAALLRAIGLGGRTGAALETAGVTSGRYPRAAGAPLLFVRGEVVSRSAGPLRRVRVDVEVVRGGRPIAARSALAGAVPTAEELFAVKDAAALDALSAAVAPRARAVRPGEPVPFLVAFTDVPDDLTGASLRVTASAVR